MMSATAADGVALSSRYRENAWTTGLVCGAGGCLRGRAEAEEHAGEDGEGCEALEGGDGAGAG